MTVNETTDEVKVSETMSRRDRRVSLHAGEAVLAVSLALSWPQTIGAQAKDERYRDDPIRRFAVVAISPEYPRTSAAADVQGVAVARVTVSDAGRPTQVEMLEAPSAEIASAVRRALLQWQFRSASQRGSELPEAHSISGTLTFYFFRRGAEYVVAAPAETPRLPHLFRKRLRLSK